LKIIVRPSNYEKHGDFSAGEFTSEEFADILRELNKQEDFELEGTFVLYKDGKNGIALDLNF